MPLAFHSLSKSLRLTALVLLLQGTISCGDSPSSVEAQSKTVGNDNPPGPEIPPVEPAPDPEPVPTPEPAPEPVPVPIPAPDPEPPPDPPTPDPEPPFEPEPVPDPEPPSDPNPDGDRDADIESIGLMARSYLAFLSSPEGIGRREAGSDEERITALYLKEQLTELGYSGRLQRFEVERNGSRLRSQNVIARTEGLSPSIIVVGAHYDSTGAGTGNDGSLGAVDNASGTAAVMALAERLQPTSLPFTIEWVLFGAEEIGMHGSWHYYRTLSDADKGRLIGMINLDSMAGGDFHYLHRPTVGTPYRCRGDASAYDADAILHSAMLQNIADVGLAEQFRVHPGSDYEGFEPGETGEWSDHVPFVCHGVPVVYFESTNFEIEGKLGADGYSQTVGEAFWNCFDPNAMSACDRESERRWGRLWHTRRDRLDVLDDHFPGRMDQQLGRVVWVIEQFLKNADQYGLGPDADAESAP